MSSSVRIRNWKQSASLAIAGLVVLCASGPVMAQTTGTSNVRVNGHLDVRAVEGNVAVGNNDFQIGQFVIGLSSEVNKRITANMDIAYASDAREIAVDEAYIDWELFNWGGLVNPDDPIEFRKTGFVLGQFDVPFGIDWRSYDSFNRPLVSLPLVITNTHRGWNDLGVQFYTQTSWSTLAVFAVNGFGTSPALRLDQTSRLPGPLVASETDTEQSLLPTEAYGARFGLFMSENVEFGTSFAAGYSEDNSQQSRLFGVDATMSFEKLELKSEFISRRRQVSSGLVQDLGYYVQSVYRGGKQFGVVRVDSYRPDGGSTNFSVSAGAGYNVFEDAELRAEYRLTEGSSNDTVYLQSVIAF